MDARWTGGADRGVRELLSDCWANGRCGRCGRCLGPISARRVHLWCRLLAGTKLMTPADFVGAFVAGLRDRAQLLEHYGAAETAVAVGSVADDLEEAFTSWWHGELTVTAASAESGYSPDRLRELVRDGTVRGSRRPGGEVKIPRSELPKRPQRPQRPQPVVDELADRITTSRQRRR